MSPKIKKLEEITKYFFELIQLLVTAGKMSRSDNLIMWYMCGSERLPKLTYTVYSSYFFYQIFKLFYGMKAMIEIYTSFVLCWLFLLILDCSHHQIFLEIYKLHIIYNHTFMLIFCAYKIMPICKRNHHFSFSSITPRLIAELRLICRFWRDWIYIYVRTDTLII